MAHRSVKCAIAIHIKDCQCGRNLSSGRWVLPAWKPCNAAERHLLLPSKLWCGSLSGLAWQEDNTRNQDEVGCTHAC